MVLPSVQNSYYTVLISRENTECESNIHYPPLVLVTEKSSNTICLYKECTRNNHLLLQIIREVIAGKIHQLQKTGKS